MFDYVVKMLFV